MFVVNAFSRIHQPPTSIYRIHTTLYSNSISSMFAAWLPRKQCNGFCTCPISIATTVGSNKKKLLKIDGACRWLHITQTKCSRFLPLVPYESPVLRQHAETVQFPLTNDDIELINDMLHSVDDRNIPKYKHPIKIPWSKVLRGGPRLWYAMWKREPDAAEGMAAPQWGISRRIFVMRKEWFGSGTRHMLGGNKTFAVVVNPEYVGVTLNDKLTADEKRTLNMVRNNKVDDIDDETCFSVPDVVGSVRRYHLIRAHFFSPDGVRHSMLLTGWAARVFQHETDHTNGILFDDETTGKCLRIKQV